MKFYVVTWCENEKVKSKAFKYRKSAEKFGGKMLDIWGCQIDIATWVDDVQKCVDVYH